MFALLPVYSLTPFSRFYIGTHQVTPSGPVPVRVSLLSMRSMLRVPSPGPD